MSKKSVSSLELAHAIAPENRRILLYLAINHELNHHFQKAIDCYAKLAMLDPSSIESIDKVLQLAKKLKRPTMQARFELIRSFHLRYDSVRAGNTGLKRRSALNADVRLDSNEGPKADLNPNLTDLYLVVD